MNFNIGDKVKCIEADHSDGHLVLGEVYTVRSTWTGGAGVGQSIYLMEVSPSFKSSRFELVEDSVKEFEVGDFAECINAIGHEKQRLTKGKVYQVGRIDKTRATIYINDDFGNYISYEASRFRLVNKEPVKEFEFKAGDKVKVPWSDEVFTLEDIDDSFLNEAGLDLYFIYKKTTYAFTTTGKMSSDHDKPILTLVERPKKFKEVTKEVYANVCRIDDDLIDVYSNPDEKTCLKLSTADSLNPANKLVKITYFIEDKDE